MKKLIYGISLIALMASCENVNVTNSKDEEAVPVRVINFESDTIPTPTPKTQQPPTYSDYVVVRGTNEDNLRDNIKPYLSKGYTLIGGVSPNGGAYFQAVAH